MEDELFHFTTVEQLHKFITEVLALRELVKCPVCLDVIKDPVKILCNHVFCASCLDALINAFKDHATTKIVKCPICCKVINRVRKSIDSHVYSLMAFIEAATANVQLKFGCDILALANVKNIKLLNKKSTNETPVVNVRQNLRRSTSIIQATELDNSLDDKEPDPFDLVMNSNNRNPFFKSKMYSKKYKSKNAVKSKRIIVHDKIHDFKNVKSKADIVQWLSNTKNSFERMTQTQEIDYDVHCSQLSFNMPSVSQTVQRYFVDKQKRRPRSLEVDVKTPIVKVNRHSFSEGSQNLNDVNRGVHIDEVESDENVQTSEKDFLRLLEEDMLNSIESELHLNNLELVKHPTKTPLKEINDNCERKTKENQPKKMDHKNRIKMGQIDISENQNASTSENQNVWSRIKKNNKSLSKTNQKLKKLKIQSTLSKTKEKTNEKALVVDLNKLEDEVDQVFNLCQKVPGDEKSSPAKEHIKNIRVKDGDIVNEDSNISREVQQVDDNFVCNATKTSRKKRKLVSSSVFSVDNLDKIEYSGKCAEFKGFNDQDNSKSSARNMTLEESFNANLIHDIENAVKEFKVDLNNSYKVKSFMDKLQLVIENLKFTLKPVLNKQNISVGSTQTVNFDTKTAYVQTDSLKSSGFKISSTEAFKTRELCSTGVQTEEFYCSNCKAPSAASQTSSSASTPSIIFVDDTVSFTTRTSKQLAQLSHENSKNDCNKLSNIENKNHTSQNISPSKEFATDNLQSSSEPKSKTVPESDNIFKGLNKSTNIIAVESSFSKIVGQSNTPLNDNLQSQPKPKRCTISENDKLLGDFIQTFNSPPDETTSQTLSTTIVRPKTTNTSHIRDTTEKEDTKNSHIRFSLTNELRQIKQKHFGDQDASETVRKFKRIRTPDSESDSEDGNKKKKWKNEYLADHFSIEIVSENILNDQQQSKTENSSLSIDECEKVDYGAYLDNIIKKYDSDRTESKPVSANYKQFPSKQLPIQNIPDRCDAMINNIVARQPNVDRNVLTAKQHDKNYDFHSELKNLEEAEIIVEEIIGESPIDRLMLEEEFEKPFEKLQSLPSSTTNNKNSEHQQTCTEAFMANMDIDDLPITKIDRSVAKDEDSLEDLLLINLKTPEEEYQMELAEEPIARNKPCNINILQNITIQGDSNSIPLVCNNPPVKSTTSEDIFNSDDDDAAVDVIDTTPKRQSILEKRSFQAYSQPKSLLKLLPLPVPEYSPDVISSLDPTSYLDETFTPPAEFQDEEKSRKIKSLIGGTINMEDFDETLATPNVVKEHDLSRTLNNTNVGNLEVKKITERSFTETELIQFMESKNKSIITSTQRCSVDNREWSLGFSPIRAEKKNPIELMRQQRMLPLEVLTPKLQKSQTRKATTATPKCSKQQTILGFMEKNEMSASKLDESIRPAEPPPIKIPCISCTRLTKTQIKSMSVLTQKNIVTYSASFGSNVTHMVVATDERNCLCNHTMKYLMAIVEGIWVVNFGWIKECIAQNKLVPEEPYEVLDISGRPGPQIARVTGKQRTLLSEFKIHIVPPFLSITVHEIKDMITKLGGQLIEDMELLSTVSGIRIIITESNTNDQLERDHWTETYGVLPVDVEWFSRSVGQCKLWSLRPFALCSEDNIDNLGYPPELVEDTQLTYFQNTEHEVNDC